MTGEATQRATAVHHHCYISMGHLHTLTFSPEGCRSSSDVELACTILQF